MISAFFTYDKPKVIQALRYHFITRREIKIMIILVNVFSITSAVLFFLHKILPLAFLISSLLWIVLMILFWYMLPNTIYKRTAAFKDRFQAVLSADKFSIQNERGGRSWNWTEFSTWIESPYFFHLYFNPRSFFIVPKSAFPGDEVHEARKILKEKIVKK